METDVIRKPTRQWAREKGLNEITACSWLRYLSIKDEQKIGTAIALTEQEFDSMVTEAKKHKRGRHRKGQK